MESSYNILSNNNLVRYLDDNPLSNLTSPYNSVLEAPNPYLKISSFGIGTPEINTPFKVPKYEFNIFDALLKYSDTQETLWISGEFHTKNLDLTLDLHPNIRMRYESELKFQDALLGEFKESYKYSEPAQIALGMCGKLFNPDTGLFYISIKIPSDKFLAQVFPNKNKVFRDAIKIFIGGHEETHATTLSGNLTKFHELLRSNYPGCINDNTLNRMKELDSVKKEIFESKRNTDVKIPHNLKESICDMSGRIALKQKGFSENMIMDVLKEVYSEIYLNT